jgi:hypothetical protein
VNLWVFGKPVVVDTDNLQTKYEYKSIILIETKTIKL